MRRSRALVLGGIVLVGAFAACTSTANLSGGGAADDAGVGPADALAETGGGSDSGGTDASSDTFVPDDAGAIFADDFSGPLGGKWDSIARTTGTLDVDTTAYVSPPQGLRATAPPSSTFAEPAYLQKRFDGAFSSFRCEMSFRRDQIGTNPAAVLRLDIETPPMKYSATVYEQPNNSGAFGLGFEPTDGGPTDATYADAPVTFAQGAWHTIAIRVDRTAIQYDVDGIPGAKITHGVSSEPTAVTLSLGLRFIYDNNTLPWSVAYDDVVCLREK